VKTAAWQPIETAPRDGTRVLVWGPHDPEPDIWFWDKHTGWAGATHWMPLPAPPMDSADPGRDAHIPFQPKETSR
jgi:hypothetical protein